MASRNPALSNNPAFRPGNGAAFAQQSTQLSSAEGLQELYNAPAATAAETDRMTYEDTIGKTVVLFIVLLLAAGVGWFAPILLLPGLVVGLVLGLVNAFKKKPSAPLIIAYAAAEGLFVGGISRFFEETWGGVVMQAVLATLVVFGVTLALFASGKVRASKRATKIFLVAMIGYAVFSLVNVGLMIFGGVDTSSMAFGLRSAPIPGLGIPFGIVIGVLAVLMAAYSLVLDFDFIKNGVANRAPRAFGWYGAYGLMVTIIWLYIEFLRMFAISRN
ncbi:Bax inhibitor-1/YccA family protein [Microbacterium sp. STN6]|uniref:Bax inhibitor-1/YccA family protein n=1 Tax=Microbacterium sp. STN6 TaxID=2995588 RepID=UPI002260F011|nr:Bax inhibitor-1/YccA family protein [Microbacterium sp. STN6]MCX7523282.1 Bax inhibitor-1/YccA family protein [Microbacterium sp. STN6]